MKTPRDPIVKLLAVATLLAGISTVKALAADGVIYADSESLKTNISLSEVLEISEFFGNPANKVKIQFPSAQSAYAYVNMSKY